MEVETNDWGCAGCPRPVRHSGVSNHQILYDLDYAPKRSRLTTFFRYILAIPAELFLLVYFIAAYFALIIAWFVVLFTARYPQGLYNFIGGAVRLSARVSAYLYLATDAYPPFSGGEHPEYPVRATLGPPLEKYSRLKVFFVGIYTIPVWIVAYAMGVVVFVCAFAAWFVIVFTGRQPEGLQDALKLGLSYQARALGVMFFLKQSYPSISAEAAESGGAMAPGGPEAPSIGI